MAARREGNPLLWRTPCGAHAVLLRRGRGLEQQVEIGDLLRLPNCRGGFANADGIRVANSYCVIV